MPKLVRLQLLPLYLLIASSIIGLIGVRYSQELMNPLGAVSCTSTGRHVRIAIDDEGFRPRKVRAEMCDRLTFINRSTSARMIAFGVHEKHISYPGYDEQQLPSNQTYSMVLVAPGTYVYHDHFNESERGQIHIAK